MDRYFFWVFLVAEKRRKKSVKNEKKKKTVQEWVGLMPNYVIIQWEIVL